jgi:hypothetical protein
MLVSFVSITNMVECLSTSRPPWTTFWQIRGLHLSSILQPGPWCACFHHWSCSQCCLHTTVASQRVISNHRGTIVYPFIALNWIVCQAKSCWILASPENSSLNYSFTYSHLPFYLFPLFAFPTYPCHDKNCVMSIMLVTWTETYLMCKNL